MPSAYSGPSEQLSDRPSNESRGNDDRNSKLSVGIDVGGTFTDILVHDLSGRETEVIKVPTTGELAEAIVDALGRFRDRARDVRLMAHASTIATNALLTHSGLAKTALITNHGFRDVLEIARQRRPELYNMYTSRPPPIVRRRDRFVVHGRMAADGTELEPLRSRETRGVAGEILKRKFEAAAIAFLNSYVNPSHEKKMLRTLRQAGFEGHVSTSSDVDREYREYERTSTTVVNAALSPLVSDYLRSLRRMLNEIGFTAPVYMMNSDGGASTLDYASRYPITVIESGPAAGVLASRELAKALSLSKVLTFDMGGTTAKAGTMLDGEPDISYEFEAAGKTHSGRSIKGSGYAVRAPFIDLAEVSSGGGTIAWVDEAGALRIGPGSAGSEPGPAAYGRGGTGATVTDANILLGRINPKYLLGGKMPLHFDLAEKAIKSIASKIGLPSSKTAEGIVRIANNNMSKAIAIVSVERGRDPRDFSMIAFGGAGPLHCCELAYELGVRKIVIPVHAGLFSAYGLLAADLSRTFTLPVLSTNEALSPYFEQLTADAAKSLKAEGFREYELKEFVDFRYRGQSYDLTLPYDQSADMKKNFAARHRQLYGYDSADEVEIVNAKIRAIVRTSTTRVKGDRISGQEVGTSSSERNVWFGGEFSRVPIFTREELPLGSHGSGPCVIEEYDSTLVINPGWTWDVQAYGTEVER